MLKSYNSYVKQLMKILDHIVLPVGILILVGILYKTKVFYNDKAMPYENNATFVLIATVLLAFGIASVWSVIDFYTFCATLNRKTQGIEFLKTSRRGKKFFMDVVIMDIVLRTFIYAVAALLLYEELHYFMGIGFREYFKQVYPLLIVGYGLGCLMLFINRHFRNSQAFMITTYLIMMFHSMIIGIFQFGMASGDMKVPKFVANHIMEIVAGVYLLVAIISNVLILYKTKLCIDKSWYND